MAASALPTIVDKFRTKQIRVLFPLHRENLTSYFSPILGQYAIKNSEFINVFLSMFNDFTNNRFKDSLNIDNADENGLYPNMELYIPLIVNIYKGGKFSLIIALPSLGFLYSKCFKKRRRYYKRFIDRSLLILRNYKKLVGFSIFKTNSFNLMGAPLIERSLYKNIRNSIHQTR